MKHFKIISLALVICMLASLVTCFAVSGETVDDYCLADLRFTQANESLTLTGAHVVAETIDGVITIQLDSAEATITMSATNSIDVLSTEKHPYFAFDFAGDVKVDSMIAHYTRKDKGEKCADLYLNSMNADANYASYRVGDKFLCSEDGTDSYGIWDWGKYLCPDPSNPPEKKVYENGIHSFKDVTCKLSGEVGKRITFYKFGVYFTSDASVLELGESCGEADMEVIKLSHINNYNFGNYEALILTQAGKTEKEITGWESIWWRMYVVENVDGKYVATKYYRNVNEVITTTVPEGGFLLYIYGDHDAAKFDDDLLGYEFYDLEGILSKDSAAIDTTVNPCMHLYAKAPAEPEPLNPDDYTITGAAVDTKITAGAKTVITDFSDGYIEALNLKYCGCILLAPTETAGIYTIVETKAASGDGFKGFDSEIKEGYIAIAIHGQSGEESGTFRNRWTDLEVGTQVIVSGYNFEAELVNDDAYVTIYISPNQVPVIPQPEEQPSEDPSQEPSQEPELPPTGDSGIVAIAILAVVALFGSAIVIKVRH